MRWTHASHARLSRNRLRLLNPFSTIEQVGNKTEPTMRDRFLYLVAAVFVLTCASMIGAVLLAVCGSSPPPLAMERLFETFLSFAAAGFFSLLGLLAAYHGQ
jgi:hypothetical protein